MTVAPVAGLLGVVLAAGAAARFGRAKQLLIWRGQTLVQHAVRRAGAVCGAGVIVMTGAEAAAVEASVQALANAGNASPPELVHHPHWRQGLGSTLAAAAALPRVQAADALLVCLVDQPEVTTADLVRLANLWQTAPAVPACASFAGGIGPPAILPAAWLAQLRELAGEHGARALLARAEATLLELPAAGADIDTPADWAALNTDTQDPA